MSLYGHDIGVIIPAFNEEARIGCTIKALIRLQCIDRILVVDDGSDDNTALVAVAAGAEVLSLPRNNGKAFAMKKGYEAIHTHVLVFLDGDIAEGADQVIKLISPVCEGKATSAIARFPMTPGKGGLGLVKTLAAKGLKFLTGSSLSSVLSGQRVFLRNAISADFFDYKGFGVEFGMTVDMLLQNMRILEVDVTMKHRTTARDFAGFLHRFRQFKDILRVFLKKVKEKTSPRGMENIQREQD